MKLTILFKGTNDKQILYGGEAEKYLIDRKWDIEDLKEVARLQGKCKIQSPFAYYIIEVKNE